MLLMRDDGAKTRRITEAFFNSNHGFSTLSGSKIARRLRSARKDRKERIGAILSNLFLAESHGFETFNWIFGATY